jgi:hypothetical protein
MKKIIFFFSVMLLPALTLAQSGDGTVGNPFYGIITTNVQWSVGNPVYGSTVYIGTSSTPDLTVGNNGHLTIDPGITVIFTQLTTDLIITGSGILTANGNSSNHIIFTKSTGIAHWGHITFETPGTGTPITGTGSFRFCDISFGHATSSGTLPSNAGGGIQVNATGVIIEDCYFENNYSNYGGGLTVNAGRNAIIRRCHFKSNSSNEAGGALLLWTNSTAQVENCIFEYNYSKGASSALYSGGAIWLLSNSSKIVNCTLVENTSDRPGDGIFSYSSPNSKIINCLLWGSNDQYAAYGSSATFTYCAFETTKPANATNSIVISSTDSDHFTDAPGGDWSLKFISPCRDAGTNSYTGVTIPTTDYIGNSTVLTKDIGAYEVQYSRWKTTAISNEWNNAANWDGGIPISESNVYIPTGATTYPTGSTTQDFTIGNGKLLLLDPGARLTLHNLTNNGTLQLNSTSAGFASLIINSYTRGSGGTEAIQLFLPGGGIELLEDYKWHYISSPVSSLQASIFTSTTLDFAQFIENRPSLSLLQGWVAYDGYVYYTGLSNGPTFSSLTIGKGYNFWDSEDNTFTFSGLLNTSDVTIPLSFSGSKEINGFNLLGNPFSSGLNWDDITHGTYFPYPDSTSKGLFFTRDNVQCTYINGVGIPGDVTGIIPPMQGFFVKTNLTGKSITLPAAARTNGNIHPTYKSASLIPLVRLGLAEDSISVDETVIRFNDIAKEGLDNDYDAVKMFLSSTRTAIYSTTTTNDKMAINGLPFPASLVEIPITINITTSGTHKLTAKQIQGLDGYSIKLIDNVTGSVIDLRENPDVTFTSDQGNISNRFKLRVNVKSVQTISFNQLATKTFGDIDFNPGATTSSELAITYTSDNPAVAVIINNSVHITGAGTTNIIAQQTGNSDYLPANDITVPLIVNKAAQLITFNPISVKILTDTDFDPGATSNSGLPIEYSSNKMSVAVITDGKIHITGTGTSTITASQPGNTNYNSATSVSQLLTVNLATSVPEILNESIMTQFRIYTSGSDIIIEPLSEEWDGKTGQINIYTISGIIIKDINNAGLNKGALIRIPVSGKGIYVVEIKSDILRYIGRAVVR